MHINNCQNGLKTAEENTYTNIQVLRVVHLEGFLGEIDPINYMVRIITTTLILEDK